MVAITIAVEVSETADFTTDVSIIDALTTDVSDIIVVTKIYSKPRHMWRGFL